MSRYLLALLFLGNFLPLVSKAELVSTSRQDKSSDDTHESTIRVAHLGNSIQYYNDFSRLLGHLLKKRYHNVIQDSCLRGGATLTSLAEKGNDMAQKFHSPAALRSDGSFDIGSPTVADVLSQKWDFVIMNDYTQGPARNDTKTKSIDTLQSIYLPQLSDSDGSLPTTVIFLMTAAYRKPAKHSSELGSFDEFTAKLEVGYAEYQALVPGSKVAPGGLAYQHIHQHYPIVWKGLYAHDNFHPSPHGTLLFAYIVFSIITDSVPPLEYSYEWWQTARYMQPPEEDPLPLPTVEEAKFLRQIACLVCGFASNGTCLNDGDDEQSVRL